MVVFLVFDGIRVSLVILGWVYVENECKKVDEEGLKWDIGLSEEDY